MVRSTGYYADCFCFRNGPVQVPSFVLILALRLQLLFPSGTWADPNFIRVGLV